MLAPFLGPPRGDAAPGAARRCGCADPTAWVVRQLACPYHRFVAKGVQGDVRRRLRLRRREGRGEHRGAAAAATVVVVV